MNKLWICLGFLAVLGQAYALSKSEYDDYEEADKPYPDISDEYDREEQPSDADTLGFKFNIDENGKVFYDDAFDDTLKIGNETVDVIDEENHDESNDRDGIDDYQIEDNRSEVKDDKEQNFGEVIENADDFDLDPKDSNIEIQSDEVTSKKSNELKENKKDDSHDMLLDYDDGLLEEESEDVDENVADMESVKESEDDNNFDDKHKSLYNKEVNEEPERIKNETENNDSSAGQNSNNEELFAETKKILEETNEAFDDEIDNGEIKEKDSEEEEEDDMSKNNSDTFSVKDNNVDNDSNEIFDEENNTSKTDRITKNSTNNQGISTESHKIKYSSTEKQNFDDVLSPGELLDDLNELKETWMKLNDEVNDANKGKENLPGFDELDTKVADMAQEVKDNNFELVNDKGSLDSRLVLDEFPVEDLDDEEIDELDEEEAEEVEPELKKSEADGSEFTAEEKSDNSKLIKYVDDALIANEGADVRNDVTETTTKHAAQEHLVEPLEDSNDLINVLINNELELNIVEPTRIILSVDKPVVLTSPNYPHPYPPNAIHDWILEGKGRGIEFNITDFALHSVNGDYVILKPGRVDPSGNDGIILSYGQKSPRQFRFLDVDRMFIRFEAKDGPNPFQGFSFSTRMIRPLADLSEVELPPQPIGYPDATIMLNLGGLTPEEFSEVQEEFRRIVADMATMFIEHNHIEHGRNTTLEVTQITRTASCFYNWPQYDKCVEVRFGVPLQYDEDVEPRLNEEDLTTMWFMYSAENPFALRLQRLGITDFQVPNNTKIMAMWLLVAAGAVIAMAMLAFAFWRYSFENYTRMPTLSDAESLGEKKTLELYPTPHQTLPPLYSDIEYKWGAADCTAVNMGGFANRSYVRTDDYDFESEEEVAVPARDRYTTDV